MEHAERAAKKLVSMRLWDDGETRWMKNAKEQNLEILLVSQFTLYGRLKGAKPDFSHAMKSEISSKFFDDFVELVRKELGDSNRVKTGKVHISIYFSFIQNSHLHFKINLHQKSLVITWM